jgi:tRNA(Ile)-lysidine synthase
MLVAEVQTCIDAYAMLSPGARVIVAVSGGPDSMALLSVLYRLRSRYSLTLIVAHVNHQLRAQEAYRDAAFVEQQTIRFGLPFYQTRVDVKALQHTSGLSPQHAARHLRYAFFHSLLDTVNATHIALGHTADDQAETLLIRLLRGGGPTGLAGIPPVRPPFIRPLITTSHPDILAYLRMEHIPWITDSSNAHRTYLRNRIRLDLLPTLQQYNPRIMKRLNELVDMLRADNVVLERQTDALIKQVVCWLPRKRAVIACEPYSTAPLALQRRVLRRLLDVLCPAHLASFKHVEALRWLTLAGRLGKRLTLPSNVLAERHRDTVRLWNTQETTTTPPVVTLTVPGEVDIPEFETRLCADVVTPACYPDQSGSGEAYLDLQLIRFPLTVRFPQPGDRFYPLGAPGRKKLKDFFIDRKIPRAERPYIPLVVSGEEIVWVVGHRIAESVKIRPTTQRVLRLRCEAQAGKCP